VIIISFVLSITTQFIVNFHIDFVAVIITIVLTTALDFYIFICVFSMYKRLEDESFGRERLLDDGYGGQTQYQSIPA
jgi:threonine/homoserine/homoserine lactone efflux protein